MSRVYSIFFFVIAILSQTAICQEDDADWRLHIIPAKERSFDFKTVAKGATPEHRFILRNPFTEPMKIGGITTSCSCTTVKFDEDKKILKTYEEIVITAKYRGDLFEGPKNAVITVVIDKPTAEIHLNVRGDIRTDLQISSHSIDFSNVELGKELSRTMTVTYRGPNTQWRLVDAKSDNEFVRAEVTRDLEKSGVGKSVFQVKVTLDKSASNGSINTHLVLMSNDPQTRREIPIPIRATVGTVITVSPPALLLGVLPPGEESPNKNALLRGTKPFRITKIECDNPAVEIKTKIEPDAPAKIVHPIVIAYQNPVEGEGSPDEEGVMRAEVRVTTDVPDLVATFYVTASVKKER